MADDAGRCRTVSRTTLRRVRWSRGMTALATTMACLVVAACDGSPSRPSPSSSSSPPVDETRRESPDGRDSWPGTEDQPWRTLGHSLRSLRPGQTLFVHGGTYKEFISRVHIHPGTPSHPVLVKAVPGEQPLVRGAVFLRQPSYWTID